MTTESLEVVAVAQAFRSHEREQVDAILKGHLPRLSPEHYRGRAFVHWTLTIENRATGWLTQIFFERWKEVLIHACSRYRLLCPAYALMPDHAHLLWVGFDGDKSDQRLAVEFLRKYLRHQLSPATWQHQVHDHVLSEKQREHRALAQAADYILANPLRAGLVSDLSHYPFIGCCVPGYPDLEIHQADHRERFWRIHNRLVERG